MTVLILFALHPPGPDMGWRRPDRSAVIIRELKFTDAQRKQFEQLRDEHHHLMMSLNDKDRHTHEALFALLKNVNDTTAEVDSLITEIGNNKKEIERATYHHLEYLREICTPEQQKIFDDIVVGLFKNEPAGPPPPRP